MSERNTALTVFWVIVDWVLAINKYYRNTTIQTPVLCGYNTFSDSLNAFCSGLKHRKCIVVPIGTPCSGSEPRTKCALSLNVRLETFHRQSRVLLVLVPSSGPIDKYTFSLMNAVMSNLLIPEIGTTLRYPEHSPNLRLLNDFLFTIILY